MDKNHAEIEEPNYQRLIYELAINYFNASTGTVFHRGHQKFKNTILNLDDKKLKPTINLLSKSDNDTDIDIQEIGTKSSWSKNILILGAGTTYNSFENIPLGDEAVIKIQEEISFPRIDKGEINLHKLLNMNDKEVKEAVGESGVSEIIKKYKDEKNRLALYSPDYLSNSEKVDFETALSLLTKFFPRSTIREKIGGIYGHSCGPTLFYELVAHLFKHRIIDVIINFNFDELLDQALNDELGKENYDMVLSDGDCKPFNDLLEDEKLKTPLYIKPHGTASHKSSLRFTKDHYHELPYDIKILLTEILSSQKSTAKNVNLISVGFNMESIEFNEIIRNTLTKDSRIFILHPASTNKKITKEEKHFKKVFKDIFQSYLKDNQQHLLPRINLIPFNAILKKSKLEPDTLGLFFQKIWTDLSSYYHKDYAPPGIARHTIISTFFGNASARNCFCSDSEKKDCESELKTNYPKDYFTKKPYHLDRAVIEIFIALAKGNGIIDPRELLNEKVGIYYSYYLSLKPKSTKKLCSLDELIKAIMGLNTQPYRSYDMLGPINLPNFKGKENFLSHNVNNRQEPLFYLLFDKDSPLRSKKIISKKFQNWLDQVGKDEKLLKILEDSFDEISQSFRSVIKANLKDRSALMFTTFKPINILHTKLSVSYHIISSLAEIPKYDTLLMVAETGQYLENLKDMLINPSLKNIVLIAARSSTVKNLKHIDYENEILDWKKNLDLNPNTNFILLYLPTRIHNHHMKLFLDLESIEGFGIYYYQHGYSEQINPMLIRTNKYLEEHNEEPKNYQDISFLVSKFLYYLEQGNIRGLRNSYIDDQRFNRHDTFKKELTLFREEMVRLI